MNKNLFLYLVTTCSLIIGLLAGFSLSSRKNQVTANVSERQRWEYKLLPDSTSNIFSTELVNKICEEEGWEIVSIPSMGHSTKVFLLRRPRR